jgi:hypothetical protein
MHYISSWYSLELILTLLQILTQIRKIPAEREAGSNHYTMIFTYVGFTLYATD